MRVQNIHKLVITRLITAWIFLSVILGGIVYYIELQKVDRFVFDLATVESRLFTATLDHARRMDNTLKDKADEFLKRHFIFVSLYDENRNQILRETRPGKEAIEAKIESHARDFPPDNTVHYRQFLIDSNSFLQVMLPLRDHKGELIGYFKGIYQVDAKTLHNIEIDIFGTLLLVVSVILITAIMLYPIIISLNRGLIALSSDLLSGNIELMDVLGSAIAKRDSDTNSHNYRVTIYAIRFAEILKLPAAQIHKLIAGAFLHDVGKIGIRDNILLKPAGLTVEEFEVMRTHVQLGADIISRSKWLAGAREVVEFHHEKFDGTGYMKGLAGNSIPLNARIFVIVDVFDALTSKRPYKEPFSFDEAINIMKPDSGKRFDPDLLSVFFEKSNALYREISHAPDDALESMLKKLIRQHFFRSG